MISENINMDTIQIVSPDFQSKHNKNQLKVIGGVIFLMGFQLSRSISYHLTLLHQYATQPNSQSITVHHKTINTIRQSQNRAEVSRVFNS